MKASPLRAAGLLELTSSWTHGDEVERGIDGRVRRVDDADGGNVVKGGCDDPDEEHGARFRRHGDVRLTTDRWEGRAEVDLVRPRSRSRARESSAEYLCTGRGHLAPDDPQVLRPGGREVFSAGSQPDVAAHFETLGGRRGSDPDLSIRFRYQCRTRRGVQLDVAGRTKVQHGHERTTGRAVAHPSRLPRGAASE